MWLFLYGLLPSLAIGAVAYGAGELLLGDNKKKSPFNDSSGSLFEVLERAKEQNNEIKRMIPLIEDIEIQNNLHEINEIVDSIILTITKNPNKKKRINNFFDYYLPVTVKIVKRYDEIENQRLSSSESKKFMKRTNVMICNIKEAFRKQLAVLYQSDLIDADAEMKVFDAMLKADGFDDTDFEIKKEED